MLIKLLVLGSEEAVVELTLDGIPLEGVLVGKSTKVSVGNGDNVWLRAEKSSIKGGTVVSLSLCLHLGVQETHHHSWCEHEHEGRCELHCEGLLNWRLFV